VTRLLLAITLSAQLVLFAFTAISCVAPRHRIWPPRRSWQLYATWFLSWVSLSGVFLLAVFGGNSMGLPTWLRLGGGVPLLATGAGLIGWGIRELSVQATMGRRGQLVRSGPYRWSRNPQYLGSCLYLASLVLLGGSYATAAGCLAVGLWFAATPFVEEPWLAEQFGVEYEAYRREVPRFFGLQRVAATRAAGADDRRR
jgi:protein-S-isoprenylcysteine O-methyltransferase Ste14